MPKGVVWNEEVVTMTRQCGRGVPRIELFRKNLELMVDLCPAGRNITVYIQSTESAQEWTDMGTWVSLNFEGTKPEDHPLEWQRIMRQMSEQNRIQGR
jgi:hypothetical protein